jgi:hypothetical protein
MTRIFHTSPQHTQHACITGIHRKTNRVWYILTSKNNGIGVRFALPFYSIAQEGRRFFTWWAVLRRRSSRIYRPSLLAFPSPCVLLMRIK